MKKMRIFSMLLVIAMLLTALTGCFCEHEWSDANCKDPKTCKNCKLKEGKPSDNHVWEDATTEAPKTCSVCGKTEGERINVDPRFKTANCKELFGTWETVYEVDSSQLGVPNFSISLKLTMSFAKDGWMKMTADVQDADTVIPSLATLLSSRIYKKFLAMGLTSKDADIIYKDQYGKTVSEYGIAQAETIVKQFTQSEINVYYAENGVIYIAEGWNRAMDSDSYEMKDGKLLLNDSDLKQVLEFTKVSP